jgi:hypothetical protein
MRLTNPPTIEYRQSFFQKRRGSTGGNTLWSVETVLSAWARPIPSPFPFTAFWAERDDHFHDFNLKRTTAEGYHLPPVHVTTEEATALITASMLMDRFTDGSLASSMDSAPSPTRFAGTVFLFAPTMRF